MPWNLPVSVSAWASPLLSSMIAVCFSCPGRAVTDGSSYARWSLAPIRARDLPSLHGLSYGAMRRVADNLDVEVRSAILPHGYYGLYDDRQRLIIIHRNMTYTMKRSTLTHELVHWAHGDDAFRGVAGNRMERRTRRQTAMLLVDPLEYAQVEQVYDGDVFRIAAELDVTKQVVEDYQNMVLSRIRDMQEAI